MMTWTVTLVLHQESLGVRADRDPLAGRARTRWVHWHHVSDASDGQGPRIQRAKSLESGCSAADTEAASGPGPALAAAAVAWPRPLYGLRVGGDDINTMSFTTLLSAQIAEW